LRKRLYLTIRSVFKLAGSGYSCMFKTSPKKWLKATALGLGIVLTLTVAFPAEALVCRTLGDRSVCILRIQRSAKYHWEYRVALRIDGVEQPQERYNCRSRIRIQGNGTPVSFDEDEGFGEMICRLVRS
jgi:hypothetical protein